MLQAYIDQLKADKGKMTREESMAQDFMERVYRGLIFAGGHVESGSVSGTDWDYLEGFDGLRLRKRWRRQGQLRSERGGGGPEIRWTRRSSMWSLRHLVWEWGTRPWFLSQSQSIVDQWEAEGVEVPFRVHNQPMARADLVAREELLEIEALWHHAVRTGNSQLEGEMHREPFLTWTPAKCCHRGAEVWDGV